MMKKQKPETAKKKLNRLAETEQQVLRTRQYWEHAGDKKRVMAQIAKHEQDIVKAQTRIDKLLQDLEVSAQRIQQCDEKLKQIRRWKKIAASSGLIQRLQRINEEVSRLQEELGDEIDPSSGETLISSKR